MDLSEIFGRPPKILVVDDDFINRELLKAYLTEADYDVVTAADGQSAFELALESPPDLALIDVQMPGMDGIELCSTLKSTPETRFVPVVIVTALDTVEEKIKAIDVGADDFVTKPFNALVLLTRVRSLLRIKRLYDEVDARNRLLRQILDRFLAEDVTDVILTDPERYLQLGGEIRPVTVLFADIRGFSRFTEEHTAPQVIETLNRVFNVLSQVVFTHHGTFDKYLGDGLMAFYGAPVASEEDAQRAVKTAIEMQHSFRELRKEDNEDMTSLALGIGIHSGEVVVGNIGSEKVMDYTVVGYAVNVAKRLQEVAQGSQILISEDTYKQVEGVKAKKLEPLHLPHLQEPVTAYLIEFS
jgi:adenylate cyclase